MNIYINIYIYRERERGRDRERGYMSQVPWEGRLILDEVVSPDTRTLTPHPTPVWVAGRKWVVGHSR